MAGALTGLSAQEPQFDLVGPTVDDDVRRLISRYGAEAVKDAIKLRTRPKRGRKPVKDWPELREVIQADARELLDGGNPFASRKNYSIAKAFADKHPGHSHPATMKRIERKLAKRYWMVLATAENLGREGYPYAAYIRVVDALAIESPHPVWTEILDRARSDLADYQAKMGTPAPDNLSIKEVETVARNSLLSGSSPQTLQSLYIGSLRS